ncbi:MAG: DUF4249 family protein [Bacteroidales bacterium]|nr:DUF4249 family protein [Bacteroidales bacterium]
MKYYAHIMLLLLGVFSTSCERTIDFVETSEALDYTLTINALAVEGSPLGVYINRTYSITDIPILPYTYGYEQINNYSVDWHVLNRNDFYKYTAVLDAHVEAVVNGNERYELTLTADTLGYWSNYKPKVGDHIMITATAGGDEAFAEATIPAKPKIEVMEYEIIQDSIIKVDNILHIDTIMRLKCHLSDTGGEHYYRLRVRSEREGYNVARSNVDGRDLLTFVDYHYRNDFISDDPLFNRSSTTNPDSLSWMGNYFGNTLAYTNAFANNTFCGQGHTFSLEIKKPQYYWLGTNISPETKDTFKDYYGRDKIEDAYRIPPRVLVELQAITPDYYKYLKSMEDYIDTFNDKESATGIFHNVQNGFGIFGALSYDRHFVEFGE